MTAAQAHEAALLSRRLATAKAALEQQQQAAERALQQQAETMTVQLQRQEAAATEAAVQAQQLQETTMSTISTNGSEFVHLLQSQDVLFFSTKIGSEGYCQSE
jgi:hypothetical protein